jgi:hypothetical protein
MREGRLVHAEQRQNNGKTPAASQQGNTCILNSRWQVHEQEKDQAGNTEGSNNDAVNKFSNKRHRVLGLGARRLLRKAAPTDPQVEIGRHKRRQQRKPQGYITE